MSPSESAASGYPEEVSFYKCLPEACVLSSDMNELHSSKLPSILGLKCLLGVTQAPIYLGVNQTYRATDHSLLTKTRVPARTKTNKPTSTPKALTEVSKVKLAELALTFIGFPLFNQTSVREVANWTGLTWRWVGIMTFTLIQRHRAMNSDQLQSNYSNCSTHCEVLVQTLPYNSTYV